MRAPGQFPLAGFTVSARPDGHVELTAAWTPDAEAAYDARVAALHGRNYAMMPEAAVVDVMARLEVFLRTHDFIGRVATKQNLSCIGQAAMDIVRAMVSTGELRWLDAETRFVYKGNPS